MAKIYLPHPPSGWLINLNFRASEYRAKLAWAMLSAAENHVNKLQISNLKYPRPPSGWLINLKLQISNLKPHIVGIDSPLIFL